jgi:hypothetical protein
VRIFKNKWFSRFAKKEGITDSELKEIVNDLENGLWDADLGGGVYKKRVARLGEGKSGSYRTIVFFKSKSRTFFPYGFAKSDRGNITSDELARFKKDAATSFALTEDQLKARIKNETLIEIIQEV